MRLTSEKFTLLKMKKKKENCWIKPKWEGEVNFVIPLHLDNYLKANLSSLFATLYMWKTPVLARRLP